MYFSHDISYHSKSWFFALFSQLQNEVLQSKHHTQRELFRKEKLEKELSKARNDLEVRGDDLRHEQGLHQQTKADLKRAEDRMKDLEVSWKP